MVRLIVHLGGAKCGSSALQRYFAENAAALKRNGILIPGSRMDVTSDIDGHQLWFYENMRPFGPEQQKAFYRRLAQLREMAEADHLHTIIISGENLINPHGFHQLFANIKSLFDPTYVLYVRRQDDYIISAWQQWYLKRGGSLDDFLKKEAGKLANWHDQLIPWEDTVGRERIVVRRYGSRYLANGDIVNDFIATMKINTEGCHSLGRTINPSFDEAIGRMATQVSDVFKNIHDNEFYNLLVYAIGDKAFKAEKRSSLLSHQQRLDLLKAYADSNAALKQKYFPDLSPTEPFFMPPEPPEVAELTPEQARDAEHRMLIRAIYGLAAKVRELEKRETTKPPLA